MVIFEIIATLRIMQVMTTADRIKLLEKEVTVLKSLFSALVPLDKEGVYKESFLKKTKSAAAEKAIGEYAGKGSLLDLVK